MGTNYVGHALLLKLLTLLLLKTASSHPVRVVSLSSAAWKCLGPEKIQFDTLKSLEGVTPIKRYSQSKTANLLCAQQFAKYYPQLTVVSVDPGEVQTQLFSREPGDDYVVHVQTNVAPKHWRPVEIGYHGKKFIVVKIKGYLIARPKTCVDENIRHYVAEIQKQMASFRYGV